MKHLYASLQYASGILSAIVFITGSAAAQNAATTSGQKATANGIRLFASSHYLPSNNALILSDSTKYFYPATSSMADSAVNFSNASGSPKVSTRHVYTYNSNGFITRDEEQKWEPTVGLYRGYKKHDYVLNSAGVVKDDIYQVWSVVNFRYENQARSSYRLDSANHIADQIDQTWNAGTSVWDSAAHFTFSYNAQGLRTFTNRQVWVPASKTWRDDYADGNYYDSTGLHLTSSFRYVWDDAAKTWNLNKGQFNTLDNSGNAIRRVYDIYVNGWKHDTRDSSSYNTARDVITRITQKWDPAASNYVNTTKEDYTYLNPKQIISIIGLSWMSGAWGIGPDAYRQNYFYESFATSVATQGMVSTELSASPNPAVDVLSIKVNIAFQQDLTFVISDMNGRVFQQFKEAGAKQIDKTISVADMPAGTYILSVRGTQGAAASRMLSIIH